MEGLNKFCIFGAVALMVLGSFLNKKVNQVGSVSELIGSPNGIYEVEGELVSDRGVVTVMDSSFSLEGTCGNLNKGCAGAGLIKIDKTGSAYRVIDLIKRPTRSSLNKIIEAEAEGESLIRILIKTEAGEEWVEVPLIKGNVQAARDLVLNKKLTAWEWDSNTSSLLRVSK